MLLHLIHHPFMLPLILTAFIGSLVITIVWTRAIARPKTTVPVSVNYHFTRKCNKECGFCFHTAESSYMLPLEDAKRGLDLLKAAGMKKLNFAGGEPFLYPQFLGKLLVYSKEVLHLESVSVVSNGSKIKESFLRQYGGHIDILAVSCDSFNEETNNVIGRGDGYNVARLRQIAEWCKEYGIMFKMNSVICRYNFDEDMAANISDIGPFRWKCFQMLVQPGENDTAGALRDARKFIISDEEFAQFVAIHEHLDCFVPESNRVMASSYLILDEYMRFLDKAKNFQSGSILEIGVAAALRTVHWDEEGFVERGGVYDWNKDMDNQTVNDQSNRGGAVDEKVDATILDW